MLSNFVRLLMIYFPMLNSCGLLWLPHCTTCIFLASAGSDSWGGCQCFVGICCKHSTLSCDCASMEYLYCSVIWGMETKQLCLPHARWPQRTGNIRCYSSVWTMTERCLSQPNMFLVVILLLFSMFSLWQDIVHFWCHPFVAICSTKHHDRNAILFDSHENAIECTFRLWINFESWCKSACPVFLYQEGRFLCASTASRSNGDIVKQSDKGLLIRLWSLFYPNKLLPCSITGSLTIRKWCPGG